MTSFWRRTDKSFANHFRHIDYQNHQNESVSKITLEKFFVVYDAVYLDSDYKVWKSLRRLHEFYASCRRIRRIYFHLPSFLSNSYAWLKNETAHKLKREHNSIYELFPTYQMNHSIFGRNSSSVGILVSIASWNHRVTRASDQLRRASTVAWDP